MVSAGIVIQPTPPPTPYMLLFISLPMCQMARISNPIYSSVATTHKGMLRVTKNRLFIVRV
jgi:hypothetical protein